jgi:hypothetical protein
MVSQRLGSIRRIPHDLEAVSLPILACSAGARNPAENRPDAQSRQNQTSISAVTVRRTPVRILNDQKAVWTSPARIRESNALGPVALVLATALVISTDHPVISSSKLQDPSLNSEASKASTGLLGGFVVATVAIYGLGALHHDNHATKTGIPSAEKQW